jgi:pimeloyl-ACP methyl ester carboxylesterase
MTTVVLVHGAFHGAWCWQRVVAGLEGHGIDARAIDLPGHGACTHPIGDLSADATAVQDAVLASEGPVIVCGHSFGGAVISEGVPKDPRVAHLVYLAAIVPDVGENTGEALGPEAAGELLQSMGESGVDGLRMDPDRAGNSFYHDCSPEDVAWAVSQLGPENAVAMGTPLSQAAWREHPSTYVVCDDDRAVQPQAQARLARRCDATLHWPTGHSPMLNRPELLVELLVDLADRVDASI